MSKLSEKQIQSKCVMYFSHKFPERRGDLFATFQESLSVQHGSNMLSMGLVPGVPDLILLENGQTTGIEMKAPETYHSTVHVLEQCRFLLDNCYFGWFCTSIEMFAGIVEKTGSGIDPWDAVAMCEKSMSKVLEVEGTEKIDDLIFKCKDHKERKGKDVPRVKF